ncbi:MAG TPA: choice-of-anchor D domain-containing protein, partial [Myxococcales bacterium]|nr:choice-of-anchor D domain-containing protein [Myxococcales bacterium]
TDSPEQPAAALDLRGHAVRGLVTLSSDGFDFGNVAVGETAMQAFSMANQDGHALTSVAIAPPQGADSDAFVLQQEGAIDMQPDQQLVVDIDFTPARLGPFSATVAVTPCPTCDPQPVTLSGRGVTSLLAVAPPALDFGNQPLGGSAAKPFSVTNTSASPLVLRSLALAGSPELTASLDGIALPFTMAPGETLAGTATYRARTLRQVSAQATFAASDGQPASLAMSGSGTGPVLQASPRSVYVGAAAIGTTRTGQILITNAGYDPDGAAPLVISNVSVISPDPDWVLLTPTPITVGAPGATATIRFYFTPQQAGLSQVILGIDSNDAVHPVVQVPVSGEGRELKPCALSVSPASPVDFGPVKLFSPSVQGFELTNVTGDDCIVGDPVLVSGGPAFRWPGGVAPTGRTLPDGGRMSVRVEFDPEQAQAYSGRVQFYVSNKGAQTMSIDLAGTGDGSCFFVTPATVDFGSTTQGCGTDVQSLYAVNQCPYTVRVTSAGTSGAPFSIGALAVPQDLAPNTSLTIPVEYSPSSTGDDVGQIRVAFDASPTPRQAGVTGGSQPATTVFDQWDQSTPKVDMLIVIDNSGSMAEEQSALAENLDHLWNRIALANADFHIAVTTTGMQPYTAGWTQCPGGASGGEGGRFFPVDGERPRILTPQTPDVRAALFANTAVGTCHWDEQFSEPVVVALTDPLINETKVPGTPWPADGNAGFLRDDARLALMAVSDTDDDIDSSNPPPVSWLVDNLVRVKHGAKDLISFAGIVPLSVCTTEESLAPRYAQIASALGGHLFDICDLSNMGAMLDSALGGLLLPLTSFPLSARPRDASAIAVTVDGAAATGWTYDANSNRIVFPPASVPVPGSHITARYTPACQ